MRCEQALVRVCDGLREDGEVDWQIARAARVKIVRNSASMNRGLGGRGGRRTARSAAFMAHLNRPGLKKCRPLSAVYMPYLLNYCAEAT